MTSKTPEIHPIQAGIMRELVFHPERKFSELNKDNVSSDQFAFHLKRLVELNFIRKVDDHYELTPTGKEFIGRFDTDTTKVAFERQAKVGALVTCVKHEGKKTFYLIQERLKQPFYGFHGFITGKIRWGETTAEGAARELMEEAGLEANLRPVGIIHKIDHSAEGELLEDKYFFAFRGEDPRGNFIENFEGGRNMWLAKDELLKMPDLYADVLDAFELFEGKNFRVVERRYTEKKY